MFEHSVKVPRHYKIAANIFKKVSTEGGSIKTLLYDNKLRHFRTNVLFALITETVKHAADIEKIFVNTNILETESRLDPWLAKVLTAELLFGKKCLPGKSKPEQTVLSYLEKFEKYASDQDLKSEGIRRPRYVRINTNLLTTSDAIREFQDEGYKFIRCTSGSYDDYLEQIKNLSEDEFTQDYHVKTVFVFAASTKLHENQMYSEFKIILQDKATTLAVHLLAPPAGSKVLDMCAAPGMKTTQAAAFMKNEGTIYAVERNPDRFKTLCDFVENTGSKCVVPINKDVLEIKRGEYEDVEYILLDPSCSGSGMELSVHKYMDESRLAKLTSLQEKFLKHAMNAFPNAKKIVYSTCSIHPEENERVVTNVVKTSRNKWRVLDAKEILKGKWNNIGSGMYGSIGNRCIYARTDSDYTTGFFVAVLERDQKDLLKRNNIEEDHKDTEEISDKRSKKDKRKSLQVHDNKEIDIESTESVNINITKNKVKKHKKSSHIEKDKSNNDTDIADEMKKKSQTKDDTDAFTELKTDVFDETYEKVKKKKRNKNHAGDENNCKEENQPERKKGKKNKKNKTEPTDNNDNEDSVNNTEVSKNKTNKTPNVDSELLENETSHNSKKRKNKKITSSVEDQEVHDAVEEPILKKKKKKKSKNNE